MEFKSHLIGGILTAGILSIFAFFVNVDIVLIIIGATICIIYSLLPDIDHPNSKARRYFDILALIIIILGICAEMNKLFIQYHGGFVAIVFAFFLLGLRFCKHRSTLHSPVFGIIISFPWVCVHPNIFVFAYCGFCTHIMLDIK